MFDQVYIESLTLRKPKTIHHALSSLPYAATFKEKNIPVLETCSQTTNNM